MTNKTGTHEWACKTVNIQYGCENNCVYCYARKMAARFNRIPKLGWDHPDLKLTINESALPRNTLVMFPSTHDITPANITPSLAMILWLVRHGNKLLIVSKPRLECITRIVDYQLPAEKLEFRFSIGTCREEIARKWEPNAPLPNERMACAKMVIEKGYKCSISMEPLLDNIDYGFMIDCFTRLQVHEIWIGAMNYMKDAPRLNYAQIYAEYKDNPLIRWKDSFRKHLPKGIYDDHTN